MVTPYVATLLTKCAQTIALCRAISACRRKIHSTQNVNNQARDNLKKKRAKVLRGIYSETSSPHYIKNDVRDNESLPTNETLYGHHAVIAALRTGKRSFGEVFLRVSLMKDFSSPVTQTCNEPQVNQQLFTLLKDRKIPIIPTNKSKLDRLAMYAIHQGICATVTPYQLKDFSMKQLENSDLGKPQLWMLIDGVKDPMNLGSLIRNSAYFGVDKIIVTGRCSRLSPVVSKASSGAMEYFDISKSENVTDMLAKMKQNNWKIIGTTCDPSRSLTLNKFRNEDRRNMLLIMGSEGEGINNVLVEYCNHFLTIPASDTCPSSLDSLNTGVASGIILYNLSTLITKT